MTDPREIVQAVAARYGMSWRDILSRNRTKRVSAVRRLAMGELRAWGLSKSAVGRVLRRDHSTIVAGLRLLGPAMFRHAPSLVAMGAGL